MNKLLWQQSEAIRQLEQRFAPFSGNQGSSSTFSPFSPHFWPPPGPDGAQWLWVIPPPRPYLYSLYLWVCFMLSFMLGGGLLSALFDKWLLVLYCCWIVCGCLMMVIAGLLTRGGFWEVVHLIFLSLFISFLWICGLSPMRTLCILSVGVRQLALWPFLLCATLTIFHILCLSVSLCINISTCSTLTL